MWMTCVECFTGCKGSAIRPGCCILTASDSVVSRLQYSCQESEGRVPCHVPADDSSHGAPEVPWLIIPHFGKQLCSAARGLWTRRGHTLVLNWSIICVVPYGPREHAIAKAGESRKSSVYAWRIPRGLPGIYIYMPDKGWHSRLPPFPPACSAGWMKRPDQINIRSTTEVSAQKLSDRGLFCTIWPETQMWWIFQRAGHFHTALRIRGLWWEIRRMSAR